MVAACLLVVMLTAESGCSVIMAARAPEKRDLAVLTPGVSRSRVVAELGKPIESQQAPTGTTDVFAFHQGYSLPTKFSRAVFHSVADFFTLGLWEIAGTPMELALQGEEVRTEVQSAPNGTVRRVEYFSGAHLANGGPTLAGWLRSKGVEQTAVVESSSAQPIATPEIMQASGTEQAGGTDSEPSLSN